MTGVRLKHLCSALPEYGLNITPDRYRDAGVRLLRTSDIATDGVVRETGGVFLDPGEVPSELLLQDGDLLFSRSGTIGRGLVYRRSDDEEATFAGFLVRFRLREGIDARAIRYWSESAPFQGTIASEAIQSTITNFNADRYANLVVPAPLVEKSSVIADYLDEEIGRLDATVGALHRSMTLMVERRRALITEVFTEPVRQGRGTTVRAIADPLLGRQRSPEHAAGPHMVRYLRAANVKDGRLDLHDVMEMNFTPGEQVTFALRPGDVLVTEGAGSLNAVGANAVWTGELEGTVCFQNTLVRLRPKPDSDPRYVAWWGRYAYESGLFRAAAAGANIFHLGVETIRALPAWAPSRATQREVADRLEAEVGALDRRASVRARQIELVLERRQALITAAVMGHLEIPGVAA